MPKGRNKDLISRRDEMLLRRFDDTLKILSEREFFISEARIMAIIRKNCDLPDDVARQAVLYR